MRQALRAYALLWLDDGKAVPEVAHRLGVTRQTVSNWAARFGERATDAMRSGRPCTAAGIIDPIIDAVSDRDPGEFGYRSTVWTAALLVEHLRDEHLPAISDDSAELAIGRLQVRWKRPCHRLALRPAIWRQAKGPCIGLTDSELTLLRIALRWQQD